MDHEQRTQAPNDFLVNLEKISLIFLELLKQASLKGFSLSSLEVLRQVGDFLITNLLSPSIRLYESTSKHKGTQTEPIKKTVISTKEIIRKQRAKGSESICDRSNLSSKTKSLGKAKRSLRNISSVNTEGMQSPTGNLYAIESDLRKKSNRSHSKDKVKNNSPLCIGSKKRKLGKVASVHQSLTKWKKLKIQEENYNPCKDFSGKRSSYPGNSKSESTMQLKNFCRKPSTSNISSQDHVTSNTKNKKVIVPLKWDQDALRKSKFISHNQTQRQYYIQAKCDVCDQIFPDLLALRKHRQGWHGFRKKNHAPSLTCDMCGMVYKKPQEISSHIMLHLNLQSIKERHERNLECQVCGKSLSTLPALLAHMKRHQTVNKFHCDFCSETFYDLLQLKSHRERHTNEEKPYKCPICGKGFRTPTTLRTHKMLHTGEKPYECDICGKRFIQTSGLNAHKLTHTAEEEMANKTKQLGREQNPLCCNICGRIYKTQLRLEEHVKSHDQENDLKCQFCSKMFTSAREATIHKRTHFDGKLICKVCGQGFGSRSELYFHSKSHESEKRPHICSKCGKSFITLADLNVHQRKHELTLDQKKTRDPFVCTVCGKIYVGRSSLTVHMKVHAGVFDLTCDFCPKKFKTPAELRHHRRVHTKEKPYVCNVCHRAFSRHSTLTNHKRSHNAERPFLCVVCGASFKLMNTLKKHSTIHTRDNKPIDKSESKDKLHDETVKHEKESPVAQNIQLDLTITTSHKEEQKTFISTEDLQRAGIASVLAYSEQFVHPPPPYPTKTHTDNTNIHSQSFEQPQGQETTGEKLDLPQMQPQTAKQLIEQAHSFLELASIPRQAAPQIASNLINSANPLLSFSGQTSKQPHQPLSLTVRQSQVQANTTSSSQRVHNIGLIQPANQIGTRRTLVRTPILSQLLATRPQNRSNTQMHQLLQLPARFQFATQSPAVSTSTQTSVYQPSEPGSSLLDQTLLHHMTRQTTPIPQGHQVQTLVTPTNLLLRQVGQLPDGDATFQVQTSGQNVNISDQVNILQTQLAQAPPAPFANTGQTLVLLSTANSTEQPEILSDENAGTSSMHPPDEISGENEEDILGEAEEEEEVDEEDNNETTETIPNLLDLTNTTTYTYYYY